MFQMQKLGAEIYKIEGGMTKVQEIFDYFHKGKPTFNQNILKLAVDKFKKQFKQTFSQGT